VLMALAGNQPTIWVEDNMPFDTPAGCEKERARLTAEITPGRNPVRVYCAGNNVVADVITGRR